MGFRIIDIETTPNPNALKFNLDQPISRGTLSFVRPPDAERDPIAASLFAIEGVVSLMFRGDFVTVNKRADADWGPIKAKVRRALAEAQPLPEAGF
ncbi:MAG: NifU N-terminal domain-containing protein [Phycisphaerales bacterium]|nr:NifU N-terminal domain-containing protein [Phycisphaerales bacterium]